MRISDWSSDVCSSDLPYKNKIRNLEPGDEGEYLNERLANEAINWIDSVKETGKPFFLNFWNYAVHTPIVPKKNLLPKYKEKPLPLNREQTPEMATMLESMDHSLGIILDWLDRPENKSVKDNTIIVFTSDNRSEEHTSELQSLMRISYAVFCLKKN